MMIQQARGQDKLFERTGVEESQLHSSMQQLNLQADPEFQKLLQESSMKMMQKAQQAQGGMGMGGGMPMGGGFF